MCTYKTCNDELSSLVVIKYLTSIIYYAVSSSFTLTPAMEEIKNFLKVSTIHGFFHINTERTWGKIFWIIVVFGGFSWAGYMIHSSIQHWYQTPISTTIESLPISQVKLPNITICPPKNSILNLNYDIMKTEKINLDKGKRTEWLDYAMKVVQDKFYAELMTNLSKVDDPDRFYNWYKGYAKITYPYYSREELKLLHVAHVSAPSGNISTRNFRKEYHEYLLDNDIYIHVSIHVPSSKVYSIYTTTIMFDIEKITIKEFSDNDKLTLNTVGIIDPDVRYFSRNFTSSRFDEYKVILNRKISQEDVSNLKLDMMPGFSLSWEYETQFGFFIYIWNYEFVR